MGKVLDFKKNSEEPKRKVWNPHIKDDIHLLSDEEKKNRLDRIIKSLEQINELMKNVKDDTDVDNKSRDS